MSTLSTPAVALEELDRLEASARALQEMTRNAVALLRDAREEAALLREAIGRFAEDAPEVTPYALTEARGVLEAIEEFAGVNDISVLVEDVDEVAETLQVGIRLMRERIEKSEAVNA